MAKYFSEKSIFIESGLEISFKDHKNVIKFDEHRFYKYLSGQGLKGVDFLVIEPKVGLILVEIKNYRDEAHQPSQEEIAAMFYQKCEDSLRLIEIIHAYYQRQWWFKLMKTFKLNIILNKEVKLWILAFEYYKSNKVKLIGDFGLNVKSNID